MSYKRENLMQKLFLTSVLILLPICASAQSINFEMLCKVKDQQILGMTKDKAYRFDEIKGGLQLGDNLRFSIELEKNGASEPSSISLTLVDEVRKNKIISTYFSMYRRNKNNPPHILVFEMPSLHQLLTIEEIGAYQINYYYLSNGLTLSHHSKNEWSGHFIKGNLSFLDITTK